jgi:hypothetical protein
MESSAMSPRLDAAARALERERGSDDLRGVRLTALAFKLAVRGPRPIAVAHAVDDDGAEHWLAVRAADGPREVAYVALLSDLLGRGLSGGAGPLIVDADGCEGLARRLELAMGPVVHAGVAREYGGCGLAW